MPMSPEMRSSLLHLTRDAAAALVEDFHYMEELLSTQNTISAQVRRLSGLVRRLLVDGDLGRIAAPRINKLRLVAPDNKPIYKLAERDGLFLFFSARAPVFGWNGAIAVGIRKTGEAFSPAPPDFNPQALIELPLDNFLTQRVIYYEKTWVSRGAVIKYVANFASGVHSNTPQTNDEKMLAHIRATNSFSRVGDGMQIALRSGPINENPVFQYSPNMIDPVLVEVLASARLVTISPAVRSLVEIIKTELALP